MLNACSFLSHPKAPLMRAAVLSALLGSIFLFTTGALAVESKLDKPNQFSALLLNSNAGQSTQLAVRWTGEPSARLSAWEYSNRGSSGEVLVLDQVPLDEAMKLFAVPKPFQRDPFDTAVSMRFQLIREGHPPLTWIEPLEWLGQPQPSSSAPETKSSDSPCEWLDGFHTSGLSAPAVASVVFDDGTGPALYTTGAFKTSGQTILHHIGKWDGTTWIPLGTGLDNTARTLAVYDDGNGPVLVAGGTFTSAGGVPVNHIAQWDGTSWAPFGTGANEPVDKLVTYNDGNGSKLAAATLAAYTAQITQWDGNNWTVLGNFEDQHGTRALSVYDDGDGPTLVTDAEIISGFLYVLKWDGEDWAPLGSGFSAQIYDLEVFNSGSGSVLVAGGGISTIDESPNNNLIQWDGESWSTLGGDFNSPVLTLEAYESANGPVLVAGGQFTQAGGIAANRIAQWDGTSWAPLGSGTNELVSSLDVADLGSGPLLIANGRFSRAGDAPARAIAQWDGESWSAMYSGSPGAGLMSKIRALTVFDGGDGPVLVASGPFMTAGDNSVNGVAQWDGTSWAPLRADPSINASVLAQYDGDNGPVLVAGGAIREAGGVYGSDLAQWDGTNWSSLGTWANGVPSALSQYDNGSGPVLIAGGSRRVDGVPGHYIAQWDGETWSSLSSGLFSSVGALAVYDNGSGPVLVAGGYFTEAGGVAANGIAQWDGATWSPLGSGVDGWVGALAVYDDGSGPVLVAGGSFTEAGGIPVNHVAQWDGITWSPLSSGVTGPVLGQEPWIETLFAYNAGNGPMLVANGVFTTAGGIPASHTAQWDGTSWSTLDSSLDHRGISFAEYDSGNGPVLMAGGNFQILDNKPSSWIGAYACPNLSLTLSNSIDEVVAGGTATYHLSIRNDSLVDASSVSLSVNFADSPLQCRWRSAGAGDASGYTSSGGTALDEILDLPIGSSVQYVISCAVDAAAAGTIQLEASASIQGMQTVTSSVFENSIVERPNVSTLILSHPGRMLEHIGAAVTDLEAMTERLHEFADHTNVDGLVVDVGFHDELAELYDQWDADVADGSSDPAAANRVLFGCNDLPPCLEEWAGVHDLVRTMLEGWPEINALMLVGDDQIFPMARIPDYTFPPREIDYTPLGSFTPDISPTRTTVGQALAWNRYLTDDPIGSRAAIEATDLDRVFLLLIPDLAVGRLVETPSEIRHSLEVFLERDGRIDLTELAPDHRVLVSGYDFLIDSARQIREDWRHSFGLPEDYAARVPLDGQLISRTWGFDNADEREDALLDHWTGAGSGSYGIMSLNGHANHYEEGVPGSNLSDIRGLAASEIAALVPELGGDGSLIYAVGCHGGLPVPGSDPEDQDHSLDLPQTFLGRGALSYLANSGFGWGLLYNVGYSEKLVTLFTEELAQPGTVILGDIMLRAKQRYYLEDTYFDFTDIKTSMQWTLFGFPMVKIETGIPEANSLGGVAGNNTSAIQTAGCLDLPEHLECQAQQNVMSDHGSFEKYRAGGEVVPQGTEGCPSPPAGEPNGCYYALNGLTTTEGGWPIEPVLVDDSRRAGTSQHGVLWTGGRYEEETGWVPLVAQPVSSGGPVDISGPLPKTTFIRPRGRASGGSLDPTQNCSHADTELNTLIFVPAEVRYDEDLEPTTHRLHYQVDLEVLYYNNNDNGFGNCDRLGPEIDLGPYHVINNNTLHFSVSANDDFADNEPADGVWRVVVVWDNETESRWQPLDLDYDAESGRWVGELEPPTGMDSVVYFLQAVDLRGNVSWKNYEAPDGTTSSGLLSSEEPGLPLPLEAILPPPGLIFWDGFETGDTSLWSGGS